ncbi:MAG: hypothetical protein HC940_08510 [Acaryochloris sp. SU_5_25]|nr:hypothetical protein [Acaryochloris sp. SU_5_25]
MNSNVGRSCRFAIALLTVSLLWACSSSPAPQTDSPETSSPEPPPPSSLEPEPTTLSPTAQSPQARGKNAEAKHHLGSISRAQMAYNLEYGKFTQKLDELDLGIKAKHFTLAGLEANQTKAIFTAIPKEPGLNSYAGGVSQLPDASYGSILCESRQPSQAIAPPILEGNTWRCAPESQKVE